MKEPWRHGVLNEMAVDNNAEMSELEYLLIVSDMEQDEDINAE